MRKNSGHDCQAQKCAYVPMTVEQLVDRLSHMPKDLPVWVSRHSPEGYDDAGFVCMAYVRDTLGLGPHVDLMTDMACREGLD